MFQKWIPVTIALALASSILSGCSTNNSNNQASPQEKQAPTTPAKAPKQYSAPPPMTIDVKKEYFATLKTTKGDIKIQLLPTESPKTVNNFVFLSRDGFYNGVKFHRIIKNFMIQTGDPLGNGTGGPGYTFDDELPIKRPYIPGVVAMANAGPNTNGSQFFICSGPDAMNLTSQPNYTIFGYVTQGMDVVHAIENSPVQADARGEKSQPTEDIRINSVTIEEKQK